MSGKTAIVSSASTWFVLVLAGWMVHAPLAAEAAGVFTWKDERGQIHFTDDPQKIPKRHRPNAVHKKMRDWPSVAPAQGSGAENSHKGENKNDSASAPLAEEAGMMQETLGFLRGDIERYKKYADFVPQRRNAILLRQEIEGALPAKQALADKLKDAEHPALVEAKAFLKQSIAKDLEAKNQQQPRRLVFIGERNRIQAEEPQKTGLIAKLKAELAAAPSPQKQAANTPPSPPKAPSPAPESGVEASSPKPVAAPEPEVESIPGRLSPVSEKPEPSGGY